MMKKKIIRILAYFLAVLTFFSAIFAYNFKESSMGMLPVINYPYREYSKFFLVFSFGFIISAILLEILTRRRVMDEK
jgi:hypothetical protein